MSWKPIDRVARTSPRPRGFTLVEMLVVIAIIGVLAALLIPAVYSAYVKAKEAALAVEIASLTNALEKYKGEKGDYPPSLGEGNYGNDLVWNQSVLRNHIIKAYPKIDPGELLLFRRLATHLSQSEALVFFLTLTRDDAKFPFFGASYPRRANITADLNDATFVPFTRDSTVSPPSQNSSVFGTSYVNASKYKNYGISFEENRLFEMTGAFDLDDVPSLVAKNCKASVYIYVDSRTYPLHFRDVDPSVMPSDATLHPITPVLASGEGTRDTNSSYADSTNVGSVVDVIRPYFADSLDPNQRYRFQNPETFQILAAGLDGKFSNSHTVFKRCPSKRAVAMSNGGNTHADAGLITLENWIDDRDNMTNFSGGKKLDDMPTQ